VEGENQTRRSQPQNIGLEITAGDHEAARNIASRRKETLMKPGTKDEVAGKIHEVKGAVKEKVGKLTNDPELEGRGKAEKLADKVQDKIGQVKKVLGT
jgi:uncharacterized protein YjbJ (UPF0337 family)